MRPAAPRIRRFPSLANRQSTSCSTRSSRCGRSNCRAIRARPDALHHRADHRRRGAERRVAVGGSRGDVPNGLRRRADCGRRCGRSSRASRSSTCSKCRRFGWRPSPVSTPRCFRTRPIFRSSSAWGEPLLFGPGSIHVAHTADEFISISELQSAITHYAAIARHLLARLT